MHKQNLSKNVCVWKTQCDFSIAIFSSMNACVSVYAQAVRVPYPKRDMHTIDTEMCQSFYSYIIPIISARCMCTSKPTIFKSIKNICADNWLCANDRQFHFYCSKNGFVSHANFGFLHVMQKNRFWFLLKCTNFRAMKWNMEKYNDPFSTQAK